MKRIALVGLPYDNNLGDPLMIECVEYFYKKISSSKGEDIEFKYIDFLGRKNKSELYYYTPQDGINKLNRYFFNGLCKITNKFIPNKYNNAQYLRWLYNPNFKKRYYKYFDEVLKDVDMIVVVGGALIKYKVIRDFHNPIKALVDIANKYDINIYFNAVGLENGYDIKDLGCRTVKEYLNSKNVKMITTRDDINTLNKYINKDSDKIVKRVADTAVWCDEIFSIDTNLYSDSDIIGIGLIEPARFVQYEQGITEEYYTNLIIDIAKKLSEKNIKWRFFTNGHVGDYEFGEKVLNIMNLPKDYLVERPVAYKELVNTINEFKAIIASRLHACIISYSLNKPVIGLDWNDKLLFFGEVINYPERFIKPKDTDADRIIDILNNAIITGYEPTYRNKYRNSIIESIEKSFDFIR